MAAADEDNFDIDIYGDGEGDMGNDGNMDYKEDDEAETDFIVDSEDLLATEETNIKSETGQPSAQAPAEVKTEEDQPKNPPTIPAKPVVEQGTKRKATTDERPTDPGATTALMISDLHWWITEDDLRGWIYEAGAEEELRELTFSEHKVNGKSKGQAYLEFISLQAATAARHKIDVLGGNGPSSRKHSVIFTNATQNPFKTLPKDAPARARDDRPTRGGSFNPAPRSETNFGINNQGFRGGRGGSFNRGGYNTHNQYNRNFSGPMGGYNHNHNANNNNMGFQGNMGMADNYGAGFNRGGMMNNPMRGNMGAMRGGSRGGMNAMMPMGNGMGMGMGNMGNMANMGNMGMNPMMAGMGMGGFQGNQFNPGMFNSGSPGPNMNGGDWNQHGVKRQRQE